MGRTEHKKQKTAAERMERLLLRFGGCLRFLGLFRKLWRFVAQLFSALLAAFSLMALELTMMRR